MSDPITMNEQRVRPLIDRVLQFLCPIAYQVGEAIEREAQSAITNAAYAQARFVSPAMPLAVTQ